MCGIIGFVGNEPAAPILLDGLERMEYRGYDSAGVAVRVRDGGTPGAQEQGAASGLIRPVHGGRGPGGEPGASGHTRCHPRGAQ